MFFSNKYHNIKLVGKRVYLRPIMGKDKKQYIEIRRNSYEFIQKWEPTWSKYELTNSGFLARLKRSDEKWRLQKGGVFLIFANDSGVLLGAIILNNLRFGVVKSVKLGYWLGCNHTKNGYMHEGIELVLSYCFNELKLHRVEAACIGSNQASRSVLLKSGFEYEGLAREYLKIDGKWQDHELYAIIKRDYFNF